MSEIRHLRVKNDLAISVLENLVKLGAIELVTEEEAFDVPEWQKDRVRAQIEKYKKHPEKLISEDDFWEGLNEG